MGWGWIRSGSSAAALRSGMRRCGWPDACEAWGVRPWRETKDTTPETLYRCCAICRSGYQASQKKRKRIEEVFGWLKTVGMLRKTRHRGLGKVRWVFTFAATAYNLVRMRNLTARSVETA